MKEKTHWLQSPNKNYLGHWDLPESGELTVTIKSAQWEPVKNPITNKTESKRVIQFKENVKPMICNQTNAQSILNSTGIKFMEDSSGQQITLFVGQTFDRISKENIDCLRVKKVNTNTKENLEKLYNQKKSKLNDELKARVEEIIVTEEVSAYSKTIKHLEQL